MDIEGWLRSLGLERYYQAFHDNDVDAKVLPEPFTSSFARCLWIDRSDRPTRPQRSSGKADVIAALRGREGVFG